VTHPELLRSLHVPGRPLVLPNAWDAASARVVAAAGFPVVATTSAGVAEALGFADHEQAPADEMLAAAARIARAVDVPVTVDFERGYGLAPDALARALSDAGAAGCNLEDTDHATGSQVEPAVQAELIAAVRAAAPELVVNARVDTFVLSPGAAQGGLVDEAVARARVYLQAGADCVYPILLHERDAIAAFVDAVAAPVNVYATQKAPPPRELAALGVARISYGSRVHRASLAWLAAALGGEEADDVRSLVVERLPDGG
jgi:2-methylisocitrate lyase-like PEP mutase family enzyme